MNLLNNIEKKYLKEQWTKGDSLEQIALVRLFDKKARWEWYFLNIDEEETEAHVISSNGLEKNIEKINFDELTNTLELYPDAIQKDIEFLPIKAKYIWQKMKRN